MTKCLRKCCPRGEYLYGRNCTDSGAEDRPVYPLVHDSNHRLLPNYDYTRFVNVYGKFSLSCLKKQTLHHIMLSNYKINNSSFPQLIATAIAFAHVS